MRTTSLPLALAAMLTLTSGACGKKEQPKPTPEPTTEAATTASAPAGEADAGASGQPRRDPETGAALADAGTTTGNDMAPAATGVFAAAALAHLPKTTYGVFVGTPDKVIAGLGADKLLVTYADDLKPFVERMQAQTGKNFLDPQTFKDMGIDLAGSAGVAGLDMDHEVSVVFATLSDPAALRKAMDELVGKAGLKFTEDKAGTATILSVGDDDRGAFVIDGSQLMVVIYGSGKGAVATAKELATLAPEASLASSVDFKNAIKDLPADEAGGYLDLAAIMKSMMARQHSDGSLEMLQKSLDDAKAAGNQAEVARLEAALADQKRWADKRAEHDAANQRVMDTVFGGLAGFGFGFDITPESVEGSFRLPMGSDGMLMKVAKNTTGIFPIVSFTKGEPLFVAAGQIDLPAYMGVLEEVMKAQGQDLAEVKSQLKAMAGLDFDKDVVGLFDGRFGISVTGDMKAIMASEDPFTQVNGGVLIGLVNPDGMRALMAKAATIEGLARAVHWDGDKGVMSIPLPMGDKTLTIQVAGNQLVISADPEFVARVAAGDMASSFVGGVTNSRLKALLERPNQAALLTFRQSVAMAVLMGRSSGFAGPTIAEPSDPALKAKYDEYVKAKKALEDADRAEEAKQQEILGALFEKLGTAGYALSVADGAITGTFGEYVNGATVPDVVGQLVALNLMKSHGDFEARREQREQLWKLESELQAKPRAIEAPAPK